MSKIEPLYRKKIAWQMVCPLCREDIREVLSSYLKRCDCGEWKAETLNGVDLYWEHTLYPNREVEQNEDGNYYAK